MRKTFKYKLYQSKKNKYLHQQINLAAEIYNKCIFLHKGYYRLFNKYLNKNKLSKWVTILKKKFEYNHWNRLNAQAIQEIVERIDNGYKLLFESRIPNTLVWGVCQGPWGL